MVGLPEKGEGRDPTVFVEWLTEIFGKDVFTHFMLWGGRTGFPRGHYHLAILPVQSWLSC